MPLEERVKMSYVTLDRICQERVDKDEGTVAVRPVSLSHGRRPVRLGG
jgi:hypothetical protein